MNAPEKHLPPQSIEAEASILSAVLNDNDSLLEIVEILHPEDFYRTAHQKIYTAMIKMFDRQEPVDLLTLMEALKKSGELEEVGGPAFLAKLLDEVPMAVNPPYHAKIIYDKACLRRLIEQAHAIIKKCHAPHEEVEDVVDFAENAMFQVAESKLKTAFSPMEELLLTSIKTLQERQKNQSSLTGVATGFPRLDELTSGLQPADLIILAARPSMGKTALALNLARNAAVQGNVPVAVFSLEMSGEQLSMRMLCSEARTDASRLRTGQFNETLWPDLHRAAGMLAETQIFIDDSPNISVMDIRAKTRRLKKDKGLGLVVIDYIQLMKTIRIGERRDLEISEVSRSLKGLAKELNVPVLALSQLNRKLEERHEKRPRLSDLRESGALEQDADMVMFIYRDEVYNEDENNPNRGLAELIIAKQRNGPLGVVPMTFLAKSTRFEQAELRNFGEMPAG